MSDTVIQLQDQTLKVIGDALQSDTMQRARRILNALHIILISENIFLMMIIS